ncbi:MAG: glycosyltransferase [Erysipelotrichia bacterium]|nr:glycosyltransferase [Erysipelotrichia bacterium]NCC55407.1 glycosyltransferase [Erysipelotrichia bacterium]
MNKISVIVPCYNEEEVLPLFHQETSKQLKSIANIDYEFIFINDGSQDHTIDILKLLAKQDSHCIYYSFSRNFGKEAAMFAGLQHASGNYCVIMDADLQHPPTLLKPMYEALSKDGYDCCAGKRVDREGENKLRNLLSKTFYKVIQKMCKLDMSDGAGDFRMMNRQMVDAILELKEYNRYMKGLFSFVGFDTKWIEFHNVERVAGETKWSFRSLFSYAFEGIFSFSNAPITIAGVIGVILLCISFILGITLCIQGLFLHYSINGFAGIITLILFLSGLQMLFVSLLGQYTSKGYMESKGRPIYIIKETNKNCHSHI